MTESFAELFEESLATQNLKPGSIVTGTIASSLTTARLDAARHLVEEGHPGRTTVHDDPIEGEHRNGARILPALLESHRPIDLLAIHLGTNDLKHRFSVTAFEIARSLERLVLAAKAEGWDPEAWEAVADEIARLTSWSSTELPAPGDPVPFRGSPALG